MKMTLTDWANSGWLQPHTTSKEEISDLLDIVARDIEAASINALSTDWKLNIAYNGALQAATAALAAAGYKAERNNHHYRVIQSLRLTIDMEAGTVSLFDTFRKKRNMSDYDRAGMVSESEADEMLDLTKSLKATVEDWLRSNHPELVP